MRIEQFKELPLAAKVTLMKKGLGKHGYKIYTGMYNLNLIFIRDMYDISNNSFNDLLVVMHGSNSRGWNIDTFDITTDPGVTYRVKPINSKGTAVVVPQQVVGGFKLGKHKGYRALVQNKNFLVYRDNDRNRLLDDSIGSTLRELSAKHHVKSANRGNGFLVYNGDDFVTIDDGKYGINCHRASKWQLLERIGLYSAGCMVHQDPYRYRDVFLPLLDTAAAKWGNSFTYTLITTNDLNV